MALSYLGKVVIFATIVFIFLWLKAEYTNTKRTLRIVAGSCLLVLTVATTCLVMQVAAATKLHHYHFSLFKLNEMASSGNSQQVTKEINRYCFDSAESNPDTARQNIFKRISTISNQMAVSPENKDKKTNE